MRFVNTGGGIFEQTKDFVISAGFEQITSVHPASHPHTGIDIVLPSGTPIFSPVDGVVSRIMDFKGESLGKAIAIKLENGKELIFGHLSSIDINKVGEHVYVGEHIANSGNTGNSTGAHLHIALKDLATDKFIDPAKYEKAFESIQKNMLGEGFTSKINALYENMAELGRFIHDVKTEGIWYAFTGHHFLESVGIGLKELGIWILSNGDVVFLIPAVIITFLTMMFGKNKFTKFIIPAFLAFWVSRFFYYMLGGQ